MDELAESVERMEAHLQDVSASVNRLEDRTYAEGGLSDETLQAVFMELPVGEGNAVPGSTGSTEAIAERAGVAEATAEMALEQLRNDMKGSVTRVEYDSDRFWYRVP
jgi:hypothetical protein